MSDLRIRLEAIDKILRQPVSNRTKLIETSRQFNGLNLTVLKRPTRDIIESHLIKMNHILCEYEGMIKSDDDYVKISRKHVKQLINITKSLSKTLLSRPTEI